MLRSDCSFISAAPLLKLNIIVEHEAAFLRAGEKHLATAVPRKLRNRLTLPARAGENERRHERFGLRIVANGVHLDVAALKAERESNGAIERRRLFLVTFGT